MDVETNLVFTSFSYRQEDRCGTGLYPENVRRVLAALQAEADVPRCRFHDLRHSAASLLLGQGVQLAEVSLLLGHSELRVTMDFCSHLMRETAAKAAKVMDAILIR